MLVFDSEKLKNELSGLHIWGNVSDFEIVTVTDNGINAYEEMKKHSYDLVIVETGITGMNATQLLRAAKSEGLCSHIAFCSEIGDFEYARQGIILGAFDYFAKPFEIGKFSSMFTRIKNESYENGAYEIVCSEELISFFENHDSGISNYIDLFFEKINSKYSSQGFADEAVKQVFEKIIDELFSKYDWLELYISKKSFFSFAENEENGLVTLQHHYKSKITELFNEYSEIYPAVQNEKISEIILYIIKNPEDDLKQKTIANNLYVSSSYLSTVFSAHTGKKFVEYLTLVRMKRAGWLLCNTELKITEIAERLDYKDIGYFSRLFKKTYNLSPSEYRTLENCSFDI